MNLGPSALGMQSLSHWTTGEVLAGLHVKGSSIQYEIKAETECLSPCQPASDVYPSAMMLKAGYQIPQVTRLRKVPPSSHLLRECLKGKYEH